MMARSAWRRLRSLAGARSYDLLWVEKEVLPWFPSALEQLAIPSRVPTVLDFDDAIFHQYDQHRSWLVRGLLGRKIDRGMAAASWWWPETNTWPRAPGGRAPRCRSFPPSSISPGTRPDRYLPAAPSPLVGSDRRQPRATCATWRPRWPPSAVGPVPRARRRPDPAFGLPGVPLEVVPWSEERDGRPPGVRRGAHAAPRHALGARQVRLQARPVHGGRAPTVAAPVGANREIVVHGETGFLASTPEEWLGAPRAAGARPTCATAWDVRGASGWRASTRSRRPHLASPRCSRARGAAGSRRRTGCADSQDWRDHRATRPTAARRPSAWRRRSSTGVRTTPAPGPIPGARSPSASGASPSSTSPPGPPAHGLGRRALHGRLQRRDLQLRRPAGGTRRARARLPRALRHRGPACADLPLGPRGHPPPALGDVRLRPLGLAASGSCTSSATGSGRSLSTTGGRGAPSSSAPS